MRTVADETNVTLKSINYAKFNDKFGFYFHFACQTPNGRKLCKRYDPCFEFFPKKEKEEKKKESSIPTPWNMVRVSHFEFICEIFRCINLIFAQFGVENRLVNSSNDDIDIFSLLCHWRRNGSKFSNVNSLQCQTHAFIQFNKC